MLKISRTCLIWIVLLTSPFGTMSGSAADSNNQGNVNSQQVREDYRAFLQQLKQLNSQYKQITGEITKVMKEEGVPNWQTGDEMKKIDELFPKEATVSNPETGVTIKENDGEMTVAVDLPGIKKESIKITIQDNKKLTISAEKKAEIEPKTVNKVIELPSAAEPDGAKATYEDGVLTLKIKKITSKEVTIPVK